MTSEFIINVNELNFEYEVVSYSMNTPVVVDFWADWCQPCKTLTPILEQIILEASGSIRMAKVNIDQNPNLALQYGVRSIPTIKAFVQGAVVSEFVGVQPPERVRSFIEQLSPPSPIDLAVEKASNLLTSGNWTDAELILREALSSKPNSPSGLLGLSKSLLAQGKSTEALQLLREFPASREFSRAESLLPLAESMEDYRLDTLLSETVNDAAYRNALRLVSKGNIPAALDGLLDILRRDKHYGSGKAHQIVLSLLEMLGEENTLTAEYRRELANVLF
ncbi:MAG TPA: thioredoxin [Anaerolineaceae bacterium]|uniref:Thioredoxin n=1 Tax=Anaerolinea thermophila TaxID=167964 RepID=A0A101FXX4_9CHLR|nr:MAG: Putative thioredoxin [Anaerolinea thermophila]HAF62654.1 thioredoxin [Anaerolineaceae bacterium]